MGGGQVIKHACTRQDGTAAVAERRRRRRRRRNGAAVHLLQCSRSRPVLRSTQSVSLCPAASRERHRAGHCREAPVRVRARMRACVCECLQVIPCVLSHTPAGQPLCTQSHTCRSAPVNSGWFAAMKGKYDSASGVSDMLRETACACACICVNVRECAYACECACL